MRAVVAWLTWSAAGRSPRRRRLANAQPPVASGCFTASRRSAPEVPVRIELSAGAGEGSLNEPGQAVQAEAAVPCCRLAQAGDPGSLERAREERAERMRRVELQVVGECRLRYRAELAVDGDRVARAHELLLRSDYREAFEPG